MTKTRWSLVGAVCAVSMVLGGAAYAYWGVYQFEPSGDVSVQWGRTLGSSNYSQIDDGNNVCGNSDYVVTGTNGSVDKYSVNLSSIPNGTVIKDFTINPCLARTSLSLPGYSNVTLTARWNGSEVWSHTYNAGWTLTPTRQVTSSSPMYNLTKDSNTTMEVWMTYDGNKGAKVSDLDVGLWVIY